MRGHSQTVARVAQMTLARVARSDDLYCNLSRAIHVTKVTLEMLYGLVAKEGFVPSSDWVHMVCATLCSKAGQVRGALNGDRGNVCIIDCNGGTTTLPEGATDAALWQYAGTRSALFVRHYLSASKVLDAEALAADVQVSNVLTDLNVTRAGKRAGIVRAASVISMLASPDFEKDLSPLYLSAKEAGIADTLGFKSAADVQQRFSDFFWEHLYPNVLEGIPLLKQTGYGHTMLANMYGHLLLKERQAG